MARSPARCAPAARARSGYKLYEARPNSPGAADAVGIARLPDGTLFNLNDTAAFKTFWGQVHSLAGVDELAALLARYQSLNPRRQVPYRCGYAGARAG